MAILENKINKLDYVLRDELQEFQGDLKDIRDDDINKLVGRIKEKGFIAPIFIWKNKILDGHQRLKALDKLAEEDFKLKDDKVPCIFIKAKTEKDAANFVLFYSDQFAEITQEGFTQFIETYRLDLADYESIKFYEEDYVIPEEPKLIVEDEFDVEGHVRHIKTKIKKGDMIKLGNHTLMCGDSTSKAEVRKLLNDTKADMCFTDPPYNLSFSGSMSNTTKNGKMIKHKGANQQHNNIYNDNMDKKEFYNFISKSLGIIKNSISGAYYITFGSQTLDELLLPMREQGFDWKSIIIWMKNQATLSGKDYKGRYEPVVYGRFNDEFYAERFLQEDIWEHQRTLKNDLHPTMKPIPLISQAIINSSRQDDKVLDLFGGSGSTLIACEQLNRKCFMMELDEHYCEVICQRWEKHTGNKREMLNG